jgi:hypothetical protein
MPRPKGKADPSAGRLSRRILDEINSEYDRGEQQRIIHRIRRMQHRVYKLAMAADGGIQIGPVIPPREVMIGQAMTQIAMAEKAITEIREKQQKIDATAATLFAALMGATDDTETSGRPKRRVIRYAEGVEPDEDGEPTQQATEPSPPEPKAWE